MIPSDTIKERLEALITQLLTDAGLELYDLEFTSNKRSLVLRVLIDRPDGFTQGQGVSMDEIVEMTRAISATLDVEDPFSQPYRLEVFSPGIERVLTRPRHYDALKGARLHVVLNRIIDKATSVDGELEGLEGDLALVRDDGGVVWRLPLHAIKRANTVYQWE
jgi:ribosome maturation factor RimP